MLTCKGGLTWLCMCTPQSQSLLLYLKSGFVTEQCDWQFEIAVERNSSVDTIGPCEKGTSLVHVGERLNPWHQQWGDLMVLLFSGSILLPWFGFSWPLTQNGHCKSNYYIHICTNYSVLIGMVSPRTIGHEAPLNALMTVKIITQCHRITEYLGDFECLSNHQAPT